MHHSNSLQLPLFPLNIVLYPNMFLPLRIFEPRYRAMVQYCLEEDEPFGVVLIAKGMPEDDEMVKPCKVGTIADIVQVHQLDEGQMNIWVAGSERFEILDYHLSPADYLVGRVLPLDDEDTDPLLFLDKTNTLDLSFRTYLELRMRLNDEEMDDFDYQLADDPAILSYQIATMLDVSLAEKQNLLELEGVADRLDQEKAVLKREIKHLQQMLSTQRKPKVEHLPWGGEVHLN